MSSNHEIEEKKKKTSVAEFVKYNHSSKIFL